jgi:beta-phosphoglucomutase
MVKRQGIINSDEARKQIVMDLKVPPFDAFIFDMDGVLVNSEPFYVEVEQTNFRKLGLTILEDEHKTYQGTATDRMWEIIKEKHGVKQTVEELVEMTNSLVTPYFASLKIIDCMPGVEQLIKQLKEQKIPLALLRHLTPDVIEIILQKTGLKNYFDVVVDSQMAGASKPEPDIFLLAAKKLGISPEKMCMLLKIPPMGLRLPNQQECIVLPMQGRVLSCRTKARQI